MKKRQILIIILLGIWVVPSTALFADYQEDEKGSDALAVGKVGDEKIQDDQAEGAVEKEAAVSDKGATVVAEAEKAPAPVWKEHVPQVKMSAFGHEIRIVVTPDAAMDAKNLEAIQSVKLESDKGEFLGLKTYGAQEKSREAEFMINPEILKMDKVKITAVSSVDGEYTTVLPLEVPKEEPKVEASPAAKEGGEEEKDALEVPAGAPSAPPVVKEETEKPKKKGWW